MKRFILSAVFIVSAAVFVTSCAKEQPEVVSKIEPAIESLNSFQGISCSMDLIGEDENPAEVKSHTVTRYIVYWDPDDIICVTQPEKKADFSLTKCGRDSTIGWFKLKEESGDIQAGEVQAFHPASMVNDGLTLTWPSEFNKGDVTPMYVKQEWNGGEQNFPFKSLGSMIVMHVSTVDSDVEINRIQLIANNGESLSGKFTVNADGMAEMTPPQTPDSKKVSFNIDPPVKIGKTATKFTVSLPSQTYTDLGLVFYTTGGKYCARKLTGDVIMAHNTARTLSLYLPEFSRVPSTN